MAKAANLLLGAILGGLVGSALALLLTPMSGNALRTEIQDYVRQVQSEVQSAANARRVELERELADLRGEVMTQ